MKIPLISKYLEKRRRVKKQREVEVTKQEFMSLPREQRRRIYTRLKTMRRKGAI